jgi:hypothetical protein
MRRLHGGIGVGLACAVAAACSVSHGEAPQLQGPLPGGSTSQLISPDGGTVTTPDGVTIVVPGGAVSTATFFSVAEDTTAGNVGTTFDLPGDGSVVTVMLVGPRYDLGSDGATLTTPVTITLPFDPTALPAGSTGSDVALYALTRYVRVTPLPTTFADPTHVSTQTSVLGLFFAGATIPSRCNDMVPCASGQTCVNGSCGGG